MKKTNDIKKNDILDNLFSNSEEDNDPKLHELIKFIEDIGNSLDVQKQDSKMTRTKKRIPKKRSSSYLSHENFEALDQAKLECQKIISKGKNKKISKSKITEISLYIVLKDFQLNKEKSILAMELDKHFSEK